MEGGSSGLTSAAGRSRWVRRCGSTSEARAPAEETADSASIGSGCGGRRGGSGRRGGDVLGLGGRSLLGLVRRRALAVRLAGALPPGGGRGYHGCDTNEAKNGHGEPTAPKDDEMMSEDFLSKAQERELP